MLADSQSRRGRELFDIRLSLTWGLELTGHKALLAFVFPSVSLACSYVMDHSSLQLDSFLKDLFLADDLSRLALFFYQFCHIWEIPSRHPQSIRQLVLVGSRVSFDLRAVRCLPCVGSFGRALGSLGARSAAILF
jgi:hypothetical protein